MKETTSSDSPIGAAADPSPSPPEQPLLSSDALSGPVAELRAARAEIVRLAEAGDTLRAAHETLQTQHAEMRARLETLQTTLADMTLQRETMTRIIRHQRAEAAHLRRDLSAALQRNGYLEDSFRQIVQSTSWRVTAPLRLAATRFRLSRPGRGLGSDR